MAVCDLEEALPQDEQVKAWCGREKKQIRAANKKEETPKEWPLALIDALLGEAGFQSFSDSASEHQVLLLERITWEEDGKERCAYVIGTKATLRVLQKKVNKGYIKIGADATFKRTFQNWCLIPIGPITKRYTRTRTPGSSAPVSAWASHLTTAIWVLASGELAMAYDIGFRVLKKYVPQVVPEIDMGRDVKQVHTDMAASAEKARRDNFTESIGVKDFWHVLVRISEMLEEYLEIPNAAGDGKKYYSAIIGWVHRSRCQCVTLAEVHNLWQMLRKHFSELGETKAMDIFFERYFEHVSVDAARSVYGCKNISMLSEGKVMLPLFWCSISQLEPGSASGSQCVEASHGGELGPNLQDENGQPLMKVRLSVRWRSLE